MSSTAKILITGAGPVGLTAAVELMRRGLIPEIIDNDGQPTPESRALAIHARTLDILEPSGVTEQLLAKGHRLNGVIIRSPRRKILSLDFRHLQHRFNFILALPQSDTEKILIKTLKKAGQQVRWFTKAQTVVPAGDGFRCTLSTSGGLETLAPDILIGADGAHSIVRKSLGFGFDGQAEPQQFGLADVRLDNWPFPFDRGVATVFDNYVSAFIPLGNGRGRFVSSRPDVLDCLPAEAKVKKVIWESTFRISYRQVDTYQKGNAFLAGDAAHIHSPAGGRGMNLGIEDAATLAWLIATRQTQRYTELRHATGAKVLKFTERQTRQITSRDRMSNLMLYVLAPVLMALPPVQRMALRHLTGLDTPVPLWLKER